MRKIFTCLLFLSLVSFTLAQVPNYIPTNGLVGWFPFNGNANDESGNGNNRTVYGGASLTTDINGAATSAYLFDGVNDYLEGPTNSALNVDNMTFSVWVKLNDSIGGNSIGGSYANPSGYHIRIIDGTVFFRIHNGNISLLLSLEISSTTTLQNNQWYHLAFSCDQNEMKLYVNGVLESSLMLGTFNFINQSRLRIGCASWDYAEYFNGIIDDIAIHNRALSNCEINQIYNAQLLSYTSVDVQTACNSYTWIDGNTYTASNNTATDTLQAVNGCDSVVSLNLTINNPTTGTDVQTACNSYTWIDGNTYTTSNNTATYTLVGGNANGCDSVVSLDLTINNPTTGTDVQTACNSYTWIDGNTYTASNSTATYTLVGGNANGCDSVVSLDLTINQPTAETDVQTACNSYTWIDGNTYTTSNNTATYTLVGGNANGCDSVVTLNLTINTVNTTVTDNSPVLISNANGATYQWLDCNNNYMPIIGETNQSFLATTNGSYAVELMQNSCVDTSICITVIDIGIAEFSNSEFRVYPNPTKESINILGGKGNYIITDILGKIVKEFKIESEQIQSIDVQKLQMGIYFIISKENNSSVKFIKQ